MASTRDVFHNLLRLGVGHGVPVSNEVFDLGGAGIVTNNQVFDINAPLIGVFNNQVFDIAGFARGTSSQVFDIGAVQYITNSQVFDIIAQQSQPDPGVFDDPPVIAGETTLASPGIAGQNSVVLTNVGAIVAGTTVMIGTETLLVTSVSGSLVTFSRPFQFSYPIGTGVLVPRATVQLASPASPGATSVTVVDPTYLTVGMTIGLRSPSGPVEYRVITAITGSVVSFTVPLRASYPSGSALSQTANFVTGLAVFDKTGARLGQIVDYTINDARSYSIREPGSMSFYVPRNSPDVALIGSDHLVAVTNSSGLPLWVGTMANESWSGGTVTVNCEDAFALLVGVPIDVNIITEIETLASGVYQMVLDKVNTRRGLDGEIQWTLDATGSKLFLGDYEGTGDPLDILDIIATRSGTEFAWRGVISGNQLQMFLVVRDIFDEGFGVDLVDGVGGNVVEGPEYQVDPTAIINGLRLTGEQTTIAAYVEDWAEWAVFEIEPSVEIYADPGSFRRRIDLDINVDWSLSKSTQLMLGQKTQDDVWGLYERYLYALHDIQGRINDEGYVYEGPPEAIEPQLTADRWRTHLELAKYRDGRPITIVMRNDIEDKWLTVSMNFSANIKSTAIFGFGSLYYSRALNATLAAGTYTIYTESGGYAQVFSQYTTAGETFEVDLASISAKLVPSGERISLRAIKRGSPLAGRYLDLREPTITITEVPPVPNIDAEGSQIANIWPRERQAIRNWDPRRDGTGAYLSKTTVYSGSLTTRPRWHLVPYSTGEEVETQLSQGLFYTDLDWVPGGPVLADVVYVDSAAGFPVDDLPFDILVGDPLFQQEIMRVYAVFGNKWSVWRGISAAPVLTTASVSVGATSIPVADVSRFLTGQVVMIGAESVTIDTISGNNLNISVPLTNAYPVGTGVASAGLIKSWGAGDLVRLVGGTKFEGFKYPYTWPEGEIYAANLLERLRYPSRLVSINVTNENDDWSSVKLGSHHVVNIQTEGPPGGVTGTVRVIGMSPDEDAGSMELVLEIE